MGSIKVIISNLKQTTEHFETYCFCQVDFVVDLACVFYISHHGRVKIRLFQSFLEKIRANLDKKKSRCCGTGASSGNLELIGDAAYLMVFSLYLGIIKKKKLINRNLKKYY